MLPAAANPSESFKVVRWLLTEPRNRNKPRLLTTDRQTDRQTRTYKENSTMLFTSQIQKLKVLLVVGALAAAAGVSHAQVLGSVWENNPNPNDASIVPPGLPTAQFTSAGINYDSNVGGYTVGGFLNNPTFFNTMPGFSPTDDGDNLFIQLTGQVYLSAGANNFAVAHDDGVVISIQGLGVLVNEPGPTAAVTTTWTANAPSSGLYGFTVDYTECCGPPAVLQWAYPNGSPVGAPDGGATLALLGLSVGGLVALRKRQ
jgi:VPDSG-CTERM motif